ncbi:YgdI/YgdR family lipoprotein, partial [Serratia sp. CY74664]|uniref:YgdI/YgdR family lipoprotein n=1 Tax=Serratia sp. CY74664 TaxID=3383676 RepID=UPI003F9F495F
THRFFSSCYGGLPPVKCGSTDGKTIVTDGKPQVDTDTGLVSYRNAETGKTEQINRDQIANMSELDN